MVHAAPNTSSTIVSKSVARGGGRTSYRGLVQIDEGAHVSRSTVKCDALLVDTISRSDTYPYVDVREDDVAMGHEATVSRVSEDQLFYLMSRGLSEDEAMAMVVRGFVEPIARELPMEYALELNRLIELQMEGAVGRWRMPPPRVPPRATTPAGRRGGWGVPPPRVPPRATTSRGRARRPTSCSATPTRRAPSTWPTMPCRPGWRRSGGSPRSSGCA